MGSVVDETSGVHVTTVRKGLVHLVATARKGLMQLVTTARKGLMHLDITCHVNVGCVCNVATGCGETGSPLPKPLACPFCSDEDIGGGGIAPQALLLTLWVCTSTLLHRAPQRVSVHLHQRCAALNGRLAISHSQPVWSCFI